MLLHEQRGRVSVPELAMQEPSLHAPGQAFQAMQVPVRQVFNVVLRVDLDGDVILPIAQQLPRFRVDLLHKRPVGPMPLVRRIAVVIHLERQRGAVHAYRLLRQPSNG
jgi:hypothetical protein